MVNKQRKQRVAENMQTAPQGTPSYFSEKHITKKELRPKSFIPRGSQEEKEMLDRLIQNLEGIDINFVEYAQDKLNLSRNLERAEDSLKPMNVYYNRRFMLFCMEPLMHGLDSESVATSATAFLGMCVMSKEFRSCIKQTLLQNKCSHIDKAISKGKISEEEGLAKKRQLIGKSLGRDMWSPKSAGNAQVTLTVSAYRAMQKEGANVNEIMENYNKAISSLYAEAAVDGVTTDEINASARTVAGKLIKHDSSYLNVFKETAYGDVHMDDFHKESEFTVKDGSVQRKEIFRWSGEFSDDKGVPFNSAFTPRIPLDKEAHSSKFRDIIIEKSQNTYNMNEFLNNLQDTIDINSNRVKRQVECMREDGIFTDDFDTAKAVFEEGVQEATFRKFVEFEHIDMTKAFHDRNVYNEAYVDFKENHFKDIVREFYETTKEDSQDEFNSSNYETKSDVGSGFDFDNAKEVEYEEFGM